MKKGSLILLILLLIGSIFASGKMYLNRKKPSNFYYTNLLAKNISLCNKYDALVLDTNFYKTEDLSSEDIIIIKSFLSELRKPNFIQKPISLPKKPLYKIFLTFYKTNEKYVINIYSNEYISIQPWDGEFTMDYITMTEIPLRYNLYNLSKHAFNKTPKFD
ncbi:DUF4883 family protein [Clostridium ganghwense]|uniref:DUF4883 family protein n=1 Tax=Clostridium ganghwense TaxID=312089 RepID=A0ABT4CP06_9CLOT|nr:DUF4883 family protein [Clostridium ganghwense]MCY6370792.1 DUF4883 family protein [Clostridium ganghwense]